MHGHRRILMLLGAATLAGCANLNQEPTIGDHAVLRSLTPAPAHDWSAPAEPSLTAGLSRDHWGATEFLVPLDGTAHQPTYILFGVDPGPPMSARDRGGYPSMATSLDIEGNAGAEAFNLFAAPVLAGAEIGASPVHAILLPPWTTVQSPGVPYERAAARVQAP